MVEPDFTPLPVYESMKQYITTQTPVLYPGVHQAEDWRVQHNGYVPLTDEEGAQFGTALGLTVEGVERECTKSVLFSAYGTEVSVRVKTEPDTGILLSIDGRLKIWQQIRHIDGWDEYVIHESILPETHQYEICADSYGDRYLIGVPLDSITVADRTFQNVAPLVAGVLIFVGMLAYVVVSSLRARWAK
jgi:hypothetical protein